MSSERRSGSLIDRIDYGSGRMFLPWPMRPGEALGFLAIMAVLSLGSLAAVLCMSFWLIEPSLWRLAPAVGWALAFRAWIAPSLIRSARPADVAARWAAFEGQGAHEE